MVMDLKLVPYAIQIQAFIERIKCLTPSVVLVKDITTKIRIWNFV